MKRILVLIILTSMALHCASRIGFLSYLYQNRHSIAYHVGLIAEVPIALCSSDYDFGGELQVHNQNEADHSTLPQFIQAHEIILFVQHVGIDLDYMLRSLSVDHFTNVVQTPYTSTILTIFHPPC